MLVAWLRVEPVRTQPLERRLVVVDDDREVACRTMLRVAAPHQVDLRAGALDPRGALGERRRWVDLVEAEQLVERDARRDPVRLDFDRYVLEGQRPSGWRTE